MYRHACTWWYPHPHRPHHQCPRPLRRLQLRPLGTNLPLRHLQLRPGTPGREPPPPPPEKVGGPESLRRDPPCALVNQPKMAARKAQQSASLSRGHHLLCLLSRPSSPDLLSPWAPQKSQARRYSPSKTSVEPEVQAQYPGLSLVALTQNHPWRSRPPYLSRSAKKFRK